MFKNIINAAFIGAMLFATNGSAIAQGFSFPGASDIDVKPRNIPEVPRNPAIDPRLEERLNIKNVSMTFNTDGRVNVNGASCVRSFLLFPVIEMLRPVSGKVSITERDIGFIGRANFTASQARRGSRSYLVLPSIRFTPDWQRIGPDYQFSFKIRVDSPAGTNWRTVNTGFYPGKYPPCEPARHR